VLAREQAADLRLIQNLGQKLGGDVAREQAIPVLLREGRMIPDLIPSPTNQRNRRSKSSRSINWRSKRSE